MRLSFDSLRSGKRIQSEEQVEVVATDRYVSIPFKRESVSKEAFSKRSIDLMIHKFPFPSPGKVSPKKPVVTWVDGKGEIEFPFPSTGKVYPKCGIKKHQGSVDLFRFPSSGKVSPKSSHSLSQVPQRCSWVSILFPWENVSKVAREGQE